ncbi:MAG: HAD-IG family 5'-nucleotidase [Planctomycetes bacterium]|nr:HAD-IG family 5'-nucleotidase [Planctomycetota bacterium]
MKKRDLPPARRIYCNRTLNLRSIGAIGYDMDYTLVHYKTSEWERRAYEELGKKLGDQGFPVESLSFDPDLVIRGLVVDRFLGNVVKADRFGYVKRAAHGTRLMDFDAQREAYSRTLVDLSSERFAFLNTLFEISEGSMYSQLVDFLEEGRLPGVKGYADLHDRVRQSIDETHLEGELKAEIAARPDLYVETDPETALAILDQRRAGRKLLLITNSEWPYTRAMMSHAFDPHLPPGTTWRDLFSLVLVSARKPHFFTDALPFFEVQSDDGLLRLGTGGLREGKVYVGGSASLVEKCLGLSGSEILYVGDHLYVDVRITTEVRRWRTALVVRELEEELAAFDAFRETERKLAFLMAEKESLEFEASQTRLALQRLQGGYGPRPDRPRAELEAELGRLRARLAALDPEIAPLARAAGEIGSARWGPLLRAGADKSHFARQLERYADIYLSRVSNFLHETPFVYLRSTPGRLPHDLAAGAPGADPDVS